MPSRMESIRELCGRAEAKGEDASPPAAHRGRARSREAISRQRQDGRPVGPPGHTSRAHVAVPSGNQLSVTTLIDAVRRDQ